MSASTEVEPVVRPRPDHPISRGEISDNTLKVLYRLSKKGYLGYLVGGGVRDLLLGRRPKDFDVVTDARPEQVRRVFRNSRIIGRRFRLVHVYFQGEIVEVATFRRNPSSSGGDDELLITSDNTYGTPREDAFRRDFTVNALFYDIDDFSVVDYVGGLEDLDRGMIRTIGDPDIRFQEDPVRMLRACEFAGRLDFSIERRTQEAIYRHRRELDKASTARVTEEIIELLRCRSSGSAFQWLHELGLLDVLLPEANAMVEAAEQGLPHMARVLPALDARVESGKEVTDIAALATVLLPAVLLRRHRTEQRRGRPMTRAALGRLTEEVVAPLASRLTISRDRAQRIERAITGFLRLCEPGWSTPERTRFARRPFFAESLLLFEVMVGATGEGHEVLAVWRRAGARARHGEGRSEAEETERRPRRRRRRRRRRRG